jgi:hypothetical protein
MLMHPDSLHAMQFRPSSAPQVRHMRPGHRPPRSDRGVRWIPLVPAAYGMWVARPARTTVLRTWRRWLQLCQRVRPVLGDHRLVAKSPQLGAVGVGSEGLDYREAPTRLAVGLVVRLPPARRSLRIGCTRSPAGWWPGTEDSVFPFIPRQLDARRRLALFSASTSRSTCFTIALAHRPATRRCAGRAFPLRDVGYLMMGFLDGRQATDLAVGGSNPSRRGKPAAQRRCRKGLTATRSWRHHRY